MSVSPSKQRGQPRKPPPLFLPFSYNEEDVFAMDKEEKEVLQGGEKK